MKMLTSKIDFADAKQVKQWRFDCEERRKNNRIDCLLFVGLLFVALLYGFGISALLDYVVKTF